MSAGKKRPIHYISKHPDLEGWIWDFAAHLEANPDKNLVVYPESFARGFAKVYETEPGLTYRIVDYRLNTDFHFQREPSETFYLIIYFYQISHSHELLMTINDKVIADSHAPDYNSLVITNSLVPQEFKLAKGAHIRGLTIQLTDEWLKEKVAYSTASNAFFKGNDVFKAFLNPKSQKLLREIFAGNQQSVTPGLYTNNRVLRLLEACLETVVKKGISGGDFPASEREAQHVLNVANLLLDSYHSEFPSIDVLARMALMSASKLKQIFKKAYGVGLYEYYQKNRMHKAKEFLSSGKYSVSEVGLMIGYQNLSNFSKAFKKEFDFLPKDVNKIE